MPKMRNEIYDEPNMALREVSGIRPHLVLGTSHKCKNVFESKEGEKS